MISAPGTPTASKIRPLVATRLRATRHFARRTAVLRHRAVSYSHFVSLMKFVLPAIALTLVVLVAVWPQLQSQDDRFRIGFSALKAREAENPSMVNARYVGIDQNSLPFSVTADLAKNLLKGNEAVELEMPKADITLKDGSWLVLTAETGIYHREAKKLQLVGAVDLFHDSGYEIRTAKAVIDLGAGGANGDQAVEGHGPFGDLAAEGFHLVDKGRIIHFTGKARLVIYPELGKPGS